MVFDVGRVRGVTQTVTLAFALCQQTFKFQDGPRELEIDVCI